MPRNSNQKLTQTEKAYLVIKRAILQGEIEEGTFLSEADVTSRYDIGRTPYREACNRLIHEGLLEAVPHRGYRIPEIPFHAAHDAFEVRLILESAIAELAAHRAEEREIDELEQLACPPAPGENLRDEFVSLAQANTAFHLHLATMARNRELAQLLKLNLEKTERLMYLELRALRFRGNDFQTFHGRIVDALRTRDPHAVQEAVLKDITEAQTTILSFGKTVHPSGNGTGGMESGAVRRGWRLPCDPNCARLQPSKISHDGATA